LQFLPPKRKDTNYTIFPISLLGWQRHLTQSQATERLSQRSVFILVSHLVLSTSRREEASNLAGYDEVCVLCPERRDMEKFDRELRAKAASLTICRSGVVSDVLSMTWR
jgi:hypothetical protein